MSQFCKVAHEFVMELDPTGELLPVSSVLNSPEFSPLYLVKRVEHSWPMSMWKPAKYFSTSLNLSMVLVDGDNFKIAQKETPLLTFSDCSHVDGSVTAEVPLGVVNTEALASHTNSRTVEKTCLEKVEVCPDELMKKLQNSKFDMNHWKLKDLKNQKVCVVVQSVRVKDEMKLIKASSSAGSLTVKPWKAIEVGVKVAGETTRELLFQKDTVLACKAYGLSISRSGDFCYASRPGERYLPTFVQGMYQTSLETYNLSCSTVQAALENELRGFSVLDQAERNEVLSLLSELLPYREALEELDSFVEAALWGDADGLSVDSLAVGVRQPVQRVLDYLEFSVPDRSSHAECSDPQPCSHKLFGPLMFLICMLKELSENTVNRIFGLDSEECKKQLDLVSTVLGQMEHTLRYRSDSNEIENYTEGSLSLVRELLASCGFNMCDEEPFLKFKDSSEQKPGLCALYATLWAINSLKTE
ncbi:hypothetical protein AOXY_G22920 [Acipenser oxyrinchus oxyrinchus]|uniref:Gasdermin pore forming domain-containing protein n=1 Tax=Acipenser oxyrinchus oxyrinchus TaxID=40147 RepID=A0AAD8FYZ1_ACIOX|nr:hypothetical protein AOXY_G22920 [Acipenser oxyrinchus oxyrinchus]